MNWIKDTNRTLHYRLTVLMSCIGIGVLMICGMLIYLQIWQGNTYQYRGTCNFTRYERVPAPRGDIVDTHGNRLATNRPILTIYWQGSEQRPWQPQQHYVLYKLEQILDTSLLDDKTLQTCEKTGKAYKVAHDISHDTLSTITAYFPYMSQLQITTEFERYYPYESYAAHIIGHIDKQYHGIMGIEKLCNHRLIGHDGCMQKHITATGKAYHHSEIVTPTPGETVTSTLHLHMQTAVETALSQQPYNGVIVCLDGYQGDILALASHPAFNPNQFMRGIDHDTWQQWHTHRALLNRACNAVYPPASVFKIITSAAALEESCITPESTWYCSGATQFGKRTYACNKASGHASVNIAQAIAHSCNIPFYEIGKELSIDTLSAYAQKCGLNSQTGFLLSEHPGLIPTHTWKEWALGERWWQGETLAATIGQSYLLVTPLQIACMINALCGGYHVRPRILADEPIHISSLSISEPTRTFLQHALRTVVTEGRAKEIQRIEEERPGLTLYAKTGTAQTSHKDRRKHGIQFREHGWFVVHAQYHQHAPITFTVLLEHSGSSRSASHTAQRIIHAYCDACDNNKIMRVY